MLPISKSPTQSFFLWGPRQTGKSTYLRQLYPDAYWVDLLDAQTAMRLLEEPWSLRRRLEQMTSLPRLVIIDEVQKVPALLDEVHLMIEQMNIVFGLCGSSARKVRRGQANLLGGRALPYEMHGLIRKEMGDAWSLEHALTRGSLPAIYTSKDPRQQLNAYVGTYLQEEILAEGLVRRLPPFADALRAAALSDGSIVSFTTIARDCGVSNPTVRGYYQIMEDTLLGTFLPAYTIRPKRRIIRSPKFYFSDVGVVNILAKRGTITKGSAAFGHALENWIHHELRAHSNYSGLHYDITYWRDRNGTEVDFILDFMETAIEVKSTDHVRDHHLKSLRTVAEDYTIKRRILVCLEPHPLKTDDGIDILPVESFLEALWQNSLIE